MHIKMNGYKDSHVVIGTNGKMSFLLSEGTEKCPVHMGEGTETSGCVVCISGLNSFYCLENIDTVTEQLERLFTQCTSSQT